MRRIDQITHGWLVYEGLAREIVRPGTGDRAASAGARDPDSATWRPTLKPTGDADIFVVEPGFRQSGEPAIFQRLADGRIASVFLAAATVARLDRVVPGG
jgi:hypothetical protein